MLLFKAADMLIQPIQAVETGGTRVNFTVTVTIPAGQPVPSEADTQKRIQDSINERFNLDNHTIDGVSASNSLIAFLKNSRIIDFNAAYL